jgi:hypothetical protein
VWQQALERFGVEFGRKIKRGRSCHNFDIRGGKGVASTGGRTYITVLFLFFSVPPTSQCPLSVPCGELTRLIPNDARQITAR